MCKGREERTTLETYSDDMLDMVIDACIWKWDWNLGHVPYHKLHKRNNCSFCVAIKRCSSPCPITDVTDGNYHCNNLVIEAIYSGYQRTKKKYRNEFVDFLYEMKQILK